GSTPFARQKTKMPAWESHCSVTAKRAHPKTAVPKWPCQLRRRVQPLPMHFVIPPVERADFAEARNAACQDFSSPVFLGCDEHRPVFSFPPFPLGSRPGDTSRSGHVEDEEAAGNESVMDTPKEPQELSRGIAAIEHVVETLSDCGDRDTGRELDCEKGAPAEFAVRHAFAGDGKHGCRLVHSQDVIAGVAKRSRPDAAAAAEVDNPTVDNPAL